jgi:hypothetical protein
MKHIRKFESFKNYKNTQPVNEEFLFGLIGKLFGKIKERINKTKGGKEIEAIYQKWLKVINTNIAKLGITELNIINQQPDKPAAKPATKDEARAKALNDLFAKQKAKIEQVIEEAKKGASQEMEGVLEKMGGAAKNPQLDKIIKSKLLQFKIDVLNAEVAALTEVGDTASASNIQKTADAESKKIEDTMKDFDTSVAVEFKVGDKVVYKRDKFVKADWDKLTPEDKKKPEEGKVKELVDKGQIEIKDISKIEGETVSFDGADFTKTKDDLLLKVGGEGEGQGEEKDKQEELTKTLGEVKTKNPESIGKLSDIANLYKDPDANKDKIAEIEKILTPETK